MLCSNLYKLYTNIYSIRTCIHPHKHKTTCPKANPVPFATGLPSMAMTLLTAMPAASGHQ